MKKQPYDLEKRLIEYTKELIKIFVASIKTAKKK